MQRMLRGRCGNGGLSRESHTVIRQAGGRAAGAVIKRTVEAALV